MKHLLLIVTILLTGFYSNGQSNEPNNYCGTTEEPNHWLEHYLLNKEQYHTENDELIANMKLHILGNDNGTGYFAPIQILDALCTVSSDFEEANIKFYLSDWLNYINNSEWNNHVDFGVGADLLIENYEFGFLNAYIATEAAGNCGYFWEPWGQGKDGVIMAKSCSQASDHTFAHELGHFLSLPHTFSGWEGTDYDPALSTQIQYPGNAFNNVENVNDPNCTNRADRFCDTTPDYLSYRWSCQTDNFSTVEQTDLNGETFRADGSLFMSYASDNCSNRFSAEQIDAMRANLQFARPELLLDDVVIEAVDESNVTLLYPAVDDLVPSNSLTIKWNKVPGATMYLIEVTRYPFTGIKLANTFISDTSFTLTNLPADKSLSYRIRPFNEGYFCTNWSERIIFETFFVSNTTDAEFVEDVSVFPSPVSNGEALNIVFHSTQQIPDAVLSIKDLAGRIVEANNIEILNGKNSYELIFDRVSPGIYLMSIESSQGNVFRKVIIQL